MKYHLYITILFTYMINVSAKQQELSLRLIAGSFTYDSALINGTTSTIGSPSIQYHIPLNNSLRIGINYEIHLNTTTQTTSLHAIGVSAKYDFYKSSESATIENKNFVLQSFPKWTYYSLLLLNKYTYYLGKNNTEDSRFEQNGDFINLDIGLGVTYTVNQEYKLFTEIGTTISSFAASDDRIKLRSKLLSLGLTRVFE